MANFKAVLALGHTVRSSLMLKRDADVEQIESPDEFQFIDYYSAKTSSFFSFKTSYSNHIVA